MNTSLRRPRHGARPASPLRGAVAAARAVATATVAAAIGVATATSIAAAATAAIGVAAANAPAPPAAAGGKEGRTPAPGPAPRVAALVPFAADQLIALGVPPVLVPAIRGEAPAAWRGIPEVAIAHTSGPNVEQLIAADPDVIITSSVYAAFAPQMERVGAEVIVMDVDAIEHLDAHVRRLGRLVGREARAHALADTLAADLAALSEAARAHATPARTGETVDVLAVMGTPHAFYAFLPSSYIGDLVARAGGRLITGDLDGHRVFRGLAPFSVETIIDRDPDVLAVVFHGSEPAARAMLERDPLWAGLSALREDRVAFLDDDLYAVRPGADVRRALEEIAAIVDRGRERLP